MQYSFHALSTRIFNVPNRQKSSHQVTSKMKWIMQFRKCPRFRLPFGSVKLPSKTRIISDFGLSLRDTIVDDDLRRTSKLLLSLQKTPFPKVWDPVLILAQIVTIQCLFYFSIGIIELVVLGKYCKFHVLFSDSISRSICIRYFTSLCVWLEEARVEEFSWSYRCYCTPFECGFNLHLHRPHCWTLQEVFGFLIDCVHHSFNTLCNLWRTPIQLGMVLEYQSVWFKVSSF